MTKNIKNIKKILVVGGTGFIGFHLSKYCLNRGWKVTSLSTRYPKKIRKLKNVKYLICNLSNKKKLNKLIIADYNYVINLGGYVEHFDKKKAIIHYIGCKNLSNIFSKRKISNFVQIGSSSEYGKLKSPHDEKKFSLPNSIYGKSKYLATQHLLTLYKKKNFPVTILRLYQTYGPQQDTNRLIPFIIKSCIKDEKFPCSAGTQLRDFVHVNDIIRSIFKCFENNKAIGNIINIGSGKPIKVRQIINFIQKNIKKGKPQFGKIKLRQEEISKSYPKILKAKKILGWKPQIKFKNGLASTIGWYLNN